MAKYKTVKRQAEVGERILVTNPILTFGYYEKGDVLTIARSLDKLVATKENGAAVRHDEYEVIVEETREALTIEQASKSIEEIMRKVRREGYAEGFERGREDEREKYGVLTMDKDGNRRDDISEQYAQSCGRGGKTAQERRDRIVERAKMDVLNLMREHSSNAVDTEFIVNREKRTVVLLRKWVSSGYIRAKGIAKCAPNDCFNVRIGKAIALRRALGLEVPVEYLNAPQPTEVRVGDMVEVTLDSGEVEVKPVIQTNEYGRLNVSLPGRMIQFPSDYAKLIDDSRDGDVPQ